MPDSLVPKTVGVLKEGYVGARLKVDVFAGLTVAIVALPLSMVIAIASGVTPDHGLYTATVGGFLVSLLGGSRVRMVAPSVPSSCSWPQPVPGTACHRVW